MTTGTPASRCDAAAGTTPSRRRFLAALGSVGVGATAGCVAYDRADRGGRWPVPGGSDARTNRTAEPGPTGDLYPAWTAETGEGHPSTTPVVAGGAAFVLQSNYSAEDPRRAFVAAYDAATGERRWVTTLLSESTDLIDVHFDSLRVADGTLYAQTIAGVHALDPATGEALWAESLRVTAQPWPRVAAPVVAAGTVVAVRFGDVSDGPELRGYDATTGDRRWRRRLSDYARPWTLAAADEVVYAPFLGDGTGTAGLVAIDAATGDVRWASPLPVDGPVAVAGASGNRRLVVPLREDEAESVAVLRASDRERLWVDAAVRRVDAGFAATDELVYYVSDGVLRARSLDSGDRVWSFGDDERPVRLGWTPVIAGDVAFAAAEVTAGDGSPTHLFALDAADGTVRGSGRVAESTPSGLAAVDGAVYLTLGRGELRCYESCALSAFGRCLVG